MTFESFSEREDRWGEAGHLTELKFSVLIQFVKFLLDRFVIALVCTMRSLTASDGK